MERDKILRSGLDTARKATKLKCSERTVYRMQKTISIINEATSKNKAIPARAQQKLNNFTNQDPSYKGIGRPPKSNTIKRNQAILDLVLKNIILTRSDISNYIRSKKALIGAIDYNYKTSKRKSNFIVHPSTAIKYLKGEPFNLKEELNSTEYLSIFNVTLPTAPERKEFILVLANASIWEESKSRSKFFCFYKKTDTISEKEILLDFYIKLLIRTHCKAKPSKYKNSVAKQKPTPKELIFTEKDAETFKELLESIKIPTELSLKDMYTYLLYFSYNPKENIPAIKEEINKLAKKPRSLKNRLADMEEEIEHTLKEFAKARANRKKTPPNTKTPPNPKTPTSPPNPETPTKPKSPTSPPNPKTPETPTKPRGGNHRRRKRQRNPRNIKPNTL